MRTPVGLFAFAMVAPAQAAVPADVHALIMTAMNESAAGWSAGDLGRFMAIYAERATFVTGDGVIRGKAAIAARYAPRFSPESAAKRGTLSFEEIDFRAIDPTHALLIARYRLKIAGAADQTGPTTLLFEKEPNGAWKIVADHSG